MIFAWFDSNPIAIYNDVLMEILGSNSLLDQKSQILRRLKGLSSGIFLAALLSSSVESKEKPACGEIMLPALDQTGVLGGRYLYPLTPIVTNRYPGVRIEMWHSPGVARTETGWTKFETDQPKDDVLQGYALFWDGEIAVPGPNTIAMQVYDEMGSLSDSWIWNSRCLVTINFIWPTTKTSEITNSD